MSRGFSRVTESAALPPPAIGLYTRREVTVRSDDSDAFSALVDRRPQVRLAAVLGEIAGDLDRRAGRFDLLHWLDEHAAALRQQVDPLASDLDRAVALFDYLAEHTHLGTREADYTDFRASLPRHVVARGAGLPIVLALIAADIGLAIGLPLQGVSAPGHFLLRLDPAEPTTALGGGAVFLDAYHRGRMRSEAATIDWLAETTGHPADLIRPALRPAPPRLVIVRVLENLKRALLTDGDWTRALAVQRRLLALRPGEVADRLDFAAIAAYGPDPAAALRMLPSLVTQLGEPAREAIERIETEARRSLVGLN